MTDGAHHEHVTQALVKDEFGGNSAVRAAEYHREGFLGISQAGPMLDALAGMRRLAGNKPLVTLFECSPSGYGVGVTHGMHCASDKNSDQRVA